MAKAVTKPAARNAPPKTASKAVATLDKRSTALSTVDEFDGVPSGRENFSAKDLLIPRLTILQDLSPQVKARQPEYIKDAAIGDFCDVALGEVFKGEIEVLPVYFEKSFLEWRPKRAGLAAIHDCRTGESLLLDCTRDDRNQMVMPNGNILVETAQWYVLNLSAGGRRSFIPMSMTQLKASRKWATATGAIRLERADGSTFPAPLLYMSWIATVRETSNDQGSWGLWNFEPGRPILEIDPSRELFNDAKAFAEQIGKGSVKGDMSGAYPEERTINGRSDEGAM